MNHDVIEAGNCDNHTNLKCIQKRLDIIMAKDENQMPTYSSILRQSEPFNQETAAASLLSSC
jgi:hypothetical protein